MNKPVLIINGIARSGKNTFVDMLNDYVEVYHYSIVDLCRETLKALNIPVNDKTDDMRRTLSDFKVLLERYDIPFNDVKSIVNDFKNGSLEYDILCVDMREVKDIKRAVKEFGAITVLITNDRIDHTPDNIADTQVFDYDNYDYVIENNGTRKELREKSKEFLKKVLTTDESCDIIKE